MGEIKCEHGKRKSRCIECNGGEICEHKCIRSRCIPCGGSEICQHLKRKSLCIECRGSEICQHLKRKSTCIECHGREICQHLKRKQQCKECKGISFCIHSKRKQDCKICGGSALCKSHLCETHKNPKYEGYCLRCFMYLFPDKPVARNYKTKEFAVVEYIKNYFPDVDWIADRIVNGGCSKRRPDLLLDLGYQVLLIEIDENKHSGYDTTCDITRLNDLFTDLGDRPMVWVRFNPDAYTNNNGLKIKSCWGTDGNGICVVKKDKKKEWQERLNCLKNTVDYWIVPENKTNKTVETIQLFY